PTVAHSFDAPCHSLSGLTAHLHTKRRVGGDADTEVTRDVAGSTAHGKEHESGCGRPSNPRARACGRRKFTQAYPMSQAQAAAQAKDASHPWAVDRSIHVDAS